MSGESTHVPQQEHQESSTSPVVPDEEPFDPIDWQQLELWAKLTPAQRVLTMIRAAEFVRAGLRGAFRQRYPQLSDREINMKVLAHLTPLRDYKP